MEKISKRTVDALKPSKVGVKVSEAFLWDSELRGFGVRVSPAGLKSFIVQYRTPEGRHRRTVIGRHGVMTPEEARDEAREMLRAVAKGIDPAAEPEPDLNAITVADLCDWYLTEADAGRILGRRRRPIKASTLTPSARARSGRLETGTPRRPTSQDATVCCDTSIVSASCTWVMP